MKRQDRCLSKINSNSYVKHHDLSKEKFEININDFSYPEIETKVENVVKTYNPFYDVLDNGIRIFKDYQMLEVA